jgi:cation transport ATPase
MLRRIDAVENRRRPRDRRHDRQTGGLVIEADRIGQDTVVAEFAWSASAAKPPPFAARGSHGAWFVPAVAVVAVAAFVAWSIWGPRRAWRWRSSAPCRC